MSPKAFFLLPWFMVVIWNSSPVAGRSFSVDYKGNTFIKDGKPYRYISGSMHYFRVPQIYWRDRLRKMKACGLDAVETYIPWNFHSPMEAKYDFSGQRNVSRFLQTVNEEGLLAIIRGFPYCDAEWDMGGLPGWLLKSENNSSNISIKLRTSDNRFLSAMSGWFDHLIPILKPHSYGRGGPIILVQLENEYGSYPYHDDKYLKFLQDELSNRISDENVVLFTTDGNNENDLRRGGINGALQTVDFGPADSVAGSFKVLRKMSPNGPLVNSEFYTGWLDHWGEHHHRTSSDIIGASFDQILAFNASVNFYMFVGGTNFEYWSGSNAPPLQQIVTSYDYDAPISECGDTTDKYFTIRHVISKYKPLPSIPIPPNVTKHSYGSVKMTNIGSIWDHLDTLSPDGPIKNPSPMTFEDLGVIGGFVIYRTTIQKLPTATPFQLYLPNSVRDYGRVYINGKHVGDLKRDSVILTLPSSCQPEDNIDILVESHGRVCYGSGIHDSKGIDAPVMLTGIDGSIVLLTDWEMWVLNLQNIGNIRSYRKPRGRDDNPTSPALFISAVEPLDVVADTFIKLEDDTWGSGYVIVNGANLGKYNVVGPQKTLYLPTSSIVDDNLDLQINILETNPSELCSSVGTICSIRLTDRPDLG